MTSTHSFPEVINLNVGGVAYSTLLSTLMKESNSMLAAMFSGRHQVLMDKNGAYFIDRDGVCFGLILNYLRDGSLPPDIDRKRLLAESRFFQIDSLTEWLESADEQDLFGYTRSRLQQEMSNRRQKAGDVYLQLRHNILRAVSKALCSFVTVKLSQVSESFDAEVSQSFGLSIALNFCGCMSRFSGIHSVVKISEMDALRLAEVLTDVQLKVLLQFDLHPCKLFANTVMSCGHPMFVMQFPDFSMSRLVCKDEVLADASGSAATATDENSSPHRQIMRLSL
eukprot:GILK01009736.1.p1 GENE.GILK01009736.1~~GILK01009736.1.p1  ORF type:complete len:281 (-),score=43.32 GILK01009736.1:326-1168(-)